VTNRVALVTSGATGLGHAIVQRMLESGWDVCFTYRQSHEEADELLSLARQLNRRIKLVHADLLDKTQVLHVAASCQETFGRIDALIHNFGPFVFERIPLAEYTDDAWNRMFDGNLNNFFWMYRAIIKSMRQQMFGRVITIGYDGAGEASGWRNRAAYAAAKAALAVVTKSIASEERDYGVTANMVCPGDIRGHAKIQMIRDVEVPGEPMKRPAVGDDVARVVQFLCDEHSQQISGTVTEVTGGYNILANELEEARHP